MQVSVILQQLPHSRQLPKTVAAYLNLPGHYYWLTAIQFRGYPLCGPDSTVELSGQHKDRPGDLEGLQNSPENLEKIR